KEKIIVGVNDYVMVEQPTEIPLLQIDESVARLQAERLQKLRAERDNERVSRALNALTEGARAGTNTMPLLLDCARAYATLGEMCDALRPVFGEYREPMF
ncbi:MAG TPA: methylmalonyl-CoA mutase family protein, partial [Blastocatellia bacterium]